MHKIVSTCISLYHKNGDILAAFKLQQCSNFSSYSAEFEHAVARHSKSFTGCRRFK